MTRFTSLRLRGQRVFICDGDEQQNLVSFGQSLDIALRHRVNLDDGSELRLVAQTFCIHSDTPGVAAIARAVSERLTAAGVQIRAMSPAGG